VIAHSHDPILFGLVLGTSLAWTAASRPAYGARLERWGGVLLVFDLAALGFALSLSH